MVDASGSDCGLLNSELVVGSLYVIVYVAKRAMTCVSRNGPL